jgi:hypothetical protein
VDIRREVYETRSCGVPDTRATTENFGTKNNADMRTEFTDFGTFLHDSIVVKLSFLHKYTT